MVGNFTEVNSRIFYVRAETVVVKAPCLLTTALALTFKHSTLSPTEAVEKE